MRIISAEGTPEELAKYEELTGWSQNPSEPVSSSASADDENDDIIDFIMSRSGSKSRFDVARKFVDAAVDRGDIIPQQGTSKASKDGYNNYLRLYKAGPRRFGAVAYFRPSSGMIDFRLSKEAADGVPGAEVRYPNKDDAYNVRIRIDSDDSIDFALVLLGHAVARIEE